MIINSSSKYNMAYFTIPQLEQRLNMTNLASSLWSITKQKLITSLKDSIVKNPSSVISLLKDLSPNTDSNNGALFRGVFIVSCERELKDLELKTLLKQFKEEHPEYDKDYPTSTINENEMASPSTTLNNITESKHQEDLNFAAENLEQDNLIFGVIDDLSHIEFISKIEGLELIRNVGDFHKVYFSIPSFRQDEVLAHSVTILPSIKCKRSLQDFII